MSSRFDIDRRWIYTRWHNETSAILFHCRHLHNPWTKRHEIWCTSTALCPKCSHLNFKFQSSAAPSNKTRLRVGRFHQKHELLCLFAKISNWYKSAKCQSVLQFHVDFYVSVAWLVSFWLHINSWKTDIGSSSDRVWTWTITSLLHLNCVSTIDFLQLAFKIPSTPHLVQKFLANSRYSDRNDHLLIFCLLKYL